jgi:hypothetical protein
LLLLLLLSVCTCVGTDQVDDNVGARQGILRGSIIVQVPVLEQHDLRRQQQKGGVVRVEVMGERREWGWMTGAR